tara:strand:- start:1067 stop:1438 length:372 start_codon:yes stop_codon:yes gene_type:complete
MKGMYRIGDLVLVNRWPTSYLVRDYCYVAEIVQIKEDASLSWTHHSLDQVYYKIKPWIDTGMLHDVTESPDIEKASLLQEIKALSSRTIWMGHNHLSPLKYNEETGEYEMAYNDDDLESWDGC